MAKSNTVKKEWQNWSWATPKGKVYTKATWPTKKEAEYAAMDIYGGDGYTVFPVLVSVK